MANRNSTRKPLTTDLQLQRLKPTGKVFDIPVANSPGLKVRVGKTGVKSFRWDRGPGFKPRVITHGRYPLLSLKNARDAHEKARQQHEAGTLNLEVFVKKVGKQTLNAPKTVADVAELYYEDYAKRNHKRPWAVRRLLDVDILPQIGEMKLIAVTPMVVRMVVDLVVARGATVYAMKVLNTLKQLFDTAVDYNAIEINPAISLKPNKLGIEDSQRSRKLSSDEIKHFWRLLDERPVFRKEFAQSRTALKLLLLLGLRTGELRQARWEYVHLDSGLLTIPVEHQKLKKAQAKKAKPFVVPLDPYAVSLFEQLRGSSEVFVFPGTKGDKPFTDFLLSRAVQRIIEGEIDHFTPHDLRRTMRTGLSKLNIKPHVAERCLNHSLGKIQDTYDTYDYLDERREALEKWSEHIQVVTGLFENNVVSIEIFGGRNG